MRWPVSIKAVVLDDDRAVLLGLNDREEWELPGGRLEPGETPEQAVRREVLEETGLAVAPRVLLRAWTFEPLPGSGVLIISYGCVVLGGGLRISTEHAAVTFHPAAQLGGLALPEGYRADIDLWLKRNGGTPEVLRGTARTGSGGAPLMGWSGYDAGRAASKCLIRSARPTPPPVEHGGPLHGLNGQHPAPC